MLYSGWDGEGRVLLLDGDPLRRHPRPADRRRHGRPLVVAAVREHPDRVPRGLLPAADRRLHDGHRLRRRRLPPRRQRRREALRLPRAGRGLDPRRPLADAAVGRARRRAGRALDEDPAPRRRHRGACCRPSATRSRSSRATCSSTARRAAAAGRTGSTGRSRRSRATSRSGSSRARRRRPATASCSTTTAAPTRRDRGRARAPARGARRRARRSTSARRSRRCSRAARRRPACAPPVPADAAALVAARGRRRGARPRPRGRRDAGAGDGVRHDGLRRHGRVSASGPRWSWSTSAVGFTDPASPLACDLDDVRRGDRAAARRVRAGRGCPVVFTTVAYDEAAKAAAAVFIDKVPGAAHARAGQPRGSRSTRGSRRSTDEPVLTKLLRVGVLRDDAGAACSPPTAATAVVVTRRVDLGLRPRDGRRRAPARLPRRSCRARRSATATRPRTRRTSTTSTRSTATSSRSTRWSRTWRSSLPHTLAEKILLAPLRRRRRPPGRRGDGALRRRHGERRHRPDRVPADGEDGRCSRSSTPRGS